MHFTFCFWGNPRDFFARVSFLCCLWCFHIFLVSGEVWVLVGKQFFCLSDFLPPLVTFFGGGGCYWLFVVTLPHPAVCCVSLAHFGFRLILWASTDTDHPHRGRKSDLRPKTCQGDFQAAPGLASHRASSSAYHESPRCIPVCLVK